VWRERHTSKTIEVGLKSHTLLAELLERKGTEEALAEAKTLRDAVAQQLARHKTRNAVELEETRAAAAEAVRQWREERIKAREEMKGGKGKKRKERRKKAKAKAKGAPSAAGMDEDAPREPAEGEAEGAAAAEAKQQVPVGELQLAAEEKEREECAVCLQDLELEDDEDPRCDDGGEGEALVVLRCGHRFHQVCGDMWCAKCADKGWSVTCSVW
jgi:hypothetical protein